MASERSDLTGDQIRRLLQEAKRPDTKIDEPTPRQVYEAVHEKPKRGDRNRMSRKEKQRRNRAKRKIVDIRDYRR